MEEYGQKLRVMAVHPSGRRAFDAVSKARLVESCFHPGASVAQLALDHGVNANLLWKWIRQHRAAKKAALVIVPPSTPAFIPVQIEAAATEVVSKRDSAVSLDSRSKTGAKRPEPEEKGRLSSSTKINASLPNGVKLTLECGDVRALTAIVGALSDVQAGR